MDTDSVSITFFLRKELADQLPKDTAELEVFVNKAIEHEYAFIAGRKARTFTKAAASRENGKKGGRPKKDKEPTI